MFLGVFLNVSEACFKCFNCLQKNVASIVFVCFKSRSSDASLLLTFCCIVSLGASRASKRWRGRVLPNRRRRAPFPSCRSGGAGPVKRETKCSVGVHPDIRPLALPNSNTIGLLYCIYCSDPTSIYDNNAQLHKASCIYISESQIIFPIQRPRPTTSRNNNERYDYILALPPRR
jgi:hypothetical protein